MCVLSTLCGNVDNTVHLIYMCIYIYIYIHWYVSIIHINRPLPTLLWKACLSYLICLMECTVFQKKNSEKTFSRNPSKEYSYITQHSFHAIINKYETKATSEAEIWIKPFSRFIQWGQNTMAKIFKRYFQIHLQRNRSCFGLTFTKVFLKDLMDSTYVTFSRGHWACMVPLLFRNQLVNQLVWEKKHSCSHLDNTSMLRKRSKERLYHLNTKLLMSLALFKIVHLIWGRTQYSIVFRSGGPTTTTVGDLFVWKFKAKMQKQKAKGKETVFGIELGATSDRHGESGYHTLESQSQHRLQRY